MKTRAVVIFVVAAFVGIMTMCTVDMLRNLAGFSAPHLTESNIVTGKVHHFYLAAETWKRFPAMPWPISMFIELRALEGHIWPLPCPVPFTDERARVGRP